MTLDQWKKINQADGQPTLYRIKMPDSTYWQAESGQTTFPPRLAGQLHNHLKLIGGELEPVR